MPQVKKLMKSDKNQSSTFTFFQVFASERALLAAKSPYKEQKKGEMEIKSEETRRRRPLHLNSGFLRPSLYLAKSLPTLFLFASISFTRGKLCLGYGSGGSRGKNSFLLSHGSPFSCGCGSEKFIIDGGGNRGARVQFFSPLRLFLPLF